MKSNDDKVMALFDKLNAKKKEISQAEKPVWNTTCTIGYNPESVGDRVNLQTVTNLAKLVEMYSFLTNKERDWAESAKELGVEVPFSWMGYSKEQWQSDIKTRVNQIELSKKRKEFATMETKLNSLISDDKRKELELAELEKQLG
jgi:hypothetical protein